MKLKRPSQFIAGIQRSEHHIKVRWLVFFTALAMGFVIVLWTFYFQGAVKLAGPEKASETAPEDQTAEIYGIMVP